MPIFVRDANGNIVSVPTLDDISFATSTQMLALLDRMPVTPHSQPLTDAQLRASAVPVSALTLPLPTGASSENMLTQVRDRLPSTAHSQPLTDAQLRATAVPVSGTFYPPVQLVSASALPLPSGASTEATLGQVRDRLPATAHTQPLTDTQLRASAVPVSATSLPLPSGAATQATLASLLTELQSVLDVAVQNFPSDFPATATVAKIEQVRALLAASLSVNVQNFPSGGAQDTTLTQVRDRLPSTPHDQPVTDAQLRASAVPVSNVSLQTVVQAISELSDSMLYFTTAILEKMPILTSNDRAMVEPSGGTVGTVTSVTGVAAVNNLYGGNTALIPWQLGAGAFHIYNQISVS